ncbi:MAG: Patatin-like phospholipase, partial [Polaromonas sp.]|nr:Patatin-like phospholipase [Polaromonas sp.]
PDPQWVRTLPNGKLPDRNDFMHYGADLPARVKAWRTATAASAQLADEFQAWLAKPDMSRLEAL